MAIKLQWEILKQEPDFQNCGYRFYIGHGDEFDVSDYREAFNIPPGLDIDEQTIKGAQDEASRTNPGEWLHVWHEGD